MEKKIETMIMESQTEKEDEMETTTYYSGCRLGTRVYHTT